MPLISSQRYEIWTEACEHDKPRPTFICRGLTTEEQMEAVRVSDSIDTGTATSFADNVEALFSILDKCIVDWKHIADANGKAIKYAPGKLKQIISPSEADELITKVFRCQVPSADEKKASGSPSRGGKAASKRSRAKKSR